MPGDDFAAIADDHVDLYTDLHRHPELAFQEHRTAGLVVRRLQRLGFEVIEGVGVTGVVGVLSNGPGATVLLRADMDGLPVLESTGLPHASTARGVDDGDDVPLMHACGHDMHVACLVGAADALVRSRTSWSGTLIVVFQPAEEVGRGAQAMVDDGLFDRVPQPDVVLGQHLAPVAAGLVGAHAGDAFAGADGLHVRLFGRGGHGSQPENTIDPVVMAAAVVMRLQTVVSRETAAADSVVVSVGQIHAGTKNNIVPDVADLGVSVRTTSSAARTRVLGALRRIVQAEATASGAERDPEITMTESLPVLVNSVVETPRVMAAFTDAFGAGRVVEPGPVAGSEDVGVLADAAGVPLVYWLFGGVDPAVYAAAVEQGTVDRDVPVNHSPFFAPVLRPTLDTGIEALVVAARQWLVPVGGLPSP